MMNIFQRCLVFCKELNFISNVGEMGFISGIKDASERQTVHQEGAVWSLASDFGRIFGLRHEWV